MNPPQVQCPQYADCNWNLLELGFRGFTGFYSICQQRVDILSNLPKRKTGNLFLPFTLLFID
jgi:hypothetical protein